MFIEKLTKKQAEKIYNNTWNKGTSDRKGIVKSIRVNSGKKEPYMILYFKKGTNFCDINGMGDFYIENNDKMRIDTNRVYRNLMAEIFGEEIYFKAFKEYIEEKFNNFIKTSDFLKQESKEIIKDAWESKEKDYIGLVDDSNRKTDKYGFYRADYIGVDLYHNDYAYDCYKKENIIKTIICKDNMIYGWQDLNTKSKEDFHMFNKPVSYKQLCTKKNHNTLDQVSYFYKPTKRYSEEKGCFVERVKLER